jgi:hypothetical protein
MMWGGHSGVQHFVCGTLNFHLWLQLRRLFTLDLPSASTTTSEAALDMRQRPKSHDKKLISAIKSRLSGLAAKPGASTRKRAKVPYSRRATCQSKLNNRLLSPQRPRKRVRERSASLARVMADLHIPFLPIIRRQRSDTE